ncbi:hypothetical protein ACGFIJ_29960 [Microbispora bryophytorum]|uniref:hypothetical protein n=1 Tax=Microbispora bryophytorum TaxID=1460882 RepID=UPI00371E51BD
MNAEKHLHDLGIWPSPAELLQGDFPEWHIWRDLDETHRHGDWVAQHAAELDRYRASDIPALRNLLDKDRRERARLRGQADEPPR